VALVLRARWKLPGTAVIVLGLARAAAAADPDPEAGRRGRAVFEERCATCHGSSGRGDGPALAGSPTRPPDFTDCRFVAREPDADFLAVAHRGGPARGFSPLMPPHGEALGEDALRDAIAHVRTFCTDPRWPRGELNLPRPLFTEKAFPEDEVVATTRANLEDDGFVESELVLEKRVGPRSQLELAARGVAREEAAPGDGWAAGGGDLSVAAKQVLFHDLGPGSIASVGAELRIPTGDEDRGLGAGTFVAEPYLAFGQLLDGDAFLQLQALAELPFDEDPVQPEAQLRAALGWSFAQDRFGRVWTPMLEAIWTSVFDGPVHHEVDLVPQVQVTLSRRQHVRVDVGLRIPVDESGRRPTQLAVYLLWDWFDGGLLEGW
jgi:mono/diheme cytochrome c family protein